MRKLYFLSLLTLSTLVTNFSYGQNPFIPKYDAVKRSERCFTVTWEANNQFGAVWWADKVDFSSDTLFNFVVYMGDRDGNGADGLAFVMHQDSRDTLTDPSQPVIIGGAGTWDLEAATGDDGGGLGFAMHQSRVGPNTIPGPHGPGDDPENHKIQNSVAVEMDTWNNNDVPDGRNGTDANGNNQVTSPYFGWDHTAVIYNGDLYGGQQIITDANGNSDRILPLKPDYAFGTGNNPDGSPHHNIEDDRCYLFQIRWEAESDGTQTLQLWADVYNGTTNTDGLQLVMTHNDDMINNVFGGDPVMRFGFTGSTGGAINEQTICLLGENLKPFAQDDYASIPVNSTAVIDVEANDNDPDGDQLHVPIIMDPARNGSATIFDSLGVNYMRYTPNTGFVGLDTVGYVTCDVNSIKCYAKCDSAFVYIDVGCIPFDVDVTALSPNLVCSDSVPANGSASANVDATFIRGTLWYEGFEDLSSGTTEDNGTSAWSTSESGPNCRPGNNIYVQNFEFRIKVVTNGDCEIVFETEEIDISNVSDVNLSIDLKTSNATYESDDYIETYYVLDGGAETMFDINGHLDGTFGTKTASSEGLNGSTLKIVVRAKADHSDEEFYWDNIHVTAVGAGVPDVTYNWYEGATPNGPIIYTGAVNNNLSDGTFTVVAIDNLTGCPSNPTTITIDSAGTHVPGGFIEQLSPFTNCELPFDGSLGAGVIDGPDTVTNGYTFEWYHQEDPKIPSFIQRTGAIAQNLESREYTVIITDNSNGCDTTLNAEVPNDVIIPTITASKIADVISCSDPNSGIGEASVAGDTTNYSFEWYAGPAVGSGPPDFTNALVNNFPVGTYTVRAIDGTTSCPSDVATITINDLTALPILQVTVDSEQTSCDTLSLTGQLTGAVDVSGTLTTTGFTFNWYKGPNDIIPARPGYTGGPTVDGLEAGSYRLVVVEDGTNCTSLIDTLIQDMTVTPPDITLNSTDVTSCAIPNGTITANVTGNLADYTFEIYKGNGVISDSLIATSASNVFQNLDIGNYTVVARDIVTQCATNPAFASIGDATVLPDANIITQDQISCDPSNPTGQLTANMGFGAITDYTYEWFEDDFSNPLTPSSVDGEVISNLDSGDYVLRITNKITSCENIYYPVVNVGITSPVEQVTSNPSDFCGVSANGQLLATVDGGLTEADGYTFIWENNSTNDTLLVNTATVNNVEPGDYILTVINDATLCASNPAPITVDDITVTPMPTIVGTDNSSCDVADPNGQLEVTNTNESPAYTLADYSYGWYDNTGTLITTTGGPNGEIVNSLGAGTYELRIQNMTTSCDNSILSQISDINIKPIIDAVTPDHADNCVDPYNSGAAIVSVNGGAPIPANYTFIWTNLDGGPSISGNGATISDIDLTDEILPPGNYEVIALNGYNCPSDPVTFEILDNSIAPVFSLTGFNNISCDPNNDVGSLVASRPAGSTYIIGQYEWFLNNTIGAPFDITVPNDSIRIDLPGGTYAVRVTDDATGCTSTEYAIIQDAPANVPIIQNISLVNLTRCDIENGELGYRVIPYDSIPPLNLNSRTYTFHLNGLSAYNQTVTGTDNVNFSGLASGNWDAYVIDNFTHCQSSTITNTLVDAPGIVIRTSIIKKPTSCIGNDGEASVTVESVDGTNKDPIGPGFDYSWYEGTDFTTSFAPNLVNSNNWTQEANNFESKYYTVSVIDRNTMCQKDTTFFVPPDITPIFLDAFPIDATQCSPGNGELTATIDHNTFGFGKNHTHYDYVMFEGSFADLSWSGPGNGEVKVVDGATIADPVNGLVDFGNDLKPGTYVIIAQEKAPSKCFGEPYIVEIELDFDFPDFVFAITPDKSCVGGSGTGQLEEISLPLANINYEWFLGSDTTVAAVSNSNPTLANLYAGNYTLVTKITSNLPAINGLGCIQDSLITVPKLLDDITLVSSFTPNNNCAPFDGTIQITDVLENGVSSGALPGDYVNFNIYDANLIAYVPSTGDGVAIPWGELGPGQYYLQTQNDITKCYSQTLQVTIDDLAQNPVISVALNNPDYACDPLLANGELEAFSTGGNQNIAEYSFEWFQGNVGDPTVSNLPIATNLSANNSSQLYTIEVVDISDINEGCVSSKAYSLLHQPTTVYVLSPQLTINPQSICGPNGSITVDEIFENDPNVGTSSTIAPYTGIYSAQLLESDLSPSPPSYATFNSTNGNFENGSGNPESIPAGTYYVRARDLTTGCAYGPLTQVIIRDESKNPIVSASLDSPDFACFGGTNTGILSPTALGGTDNDTYPNFNINWYYKGTLTSPTTDDGGGTYEDRAIDLAAGVYTVEVTDMSGADLNCITTRDYLVPAARHNFSILASGTDQTICIPDGTIQIDNVVEDGANVANPHLSWSAALLKDAWTPVIPSPSGSGFASNTDPFTGVEAGMYYVRGQDNLTQCYSNFYQVVLEDLSVDPVIDLSVVTPQYSLNPNPLSWTGSLQAAVTETDGTIGAYNMNWHHGLGTANQISGEVSSAIDSLNLGMYTFTALNTATGCESSYYIYLPFVYLEPIFNTALKAQTICSPLDGGIEVTDITLEGTPDQLSDYTFDFHNSSYASGDVPDYTIPGDDTRTAYDNINSGSYYIIAEENWWMLESYPVQVEVIDSTTNPIIIFDATNYHAVTSCDESVFTDGALAIEVFEDNTNPNLVPPFNYSYTWYNGPTSNPSNVISGEISYNISGLPSGEYTVSVMNLANNCLSEKTYTIEDVSVTPIVVATQTPNTNCPVEIANGVVTANVINSNSLHYYEWFQGTDQQSSADFTGATWSDRPIGYYTVIATDQNIGTCISEPVTIKVVDATENPIILINEISPVTNCDPERPNGVLSATTQDGIDGHTFEWFKDGNFYSSGPIASDLGLYEYQLTVTNNVTLCQTTMVSGPTALLGIIPPPDVDILSDRTSCLEPDGSATASITGNVVDYIFRYYNKFSGEELSNFYEDYTIYDLDTSAYLVTAESRITGCISEPSEFAIANESYFPEIDVIADPSNCQEPSGAANVIISDMTRDFKVTWYGDNGFEAQEKELVYIPVGKYIVEVEGTDGCITSTEAEVKGDVIIYNGVSANNDGLNEFFAVVCLEYFPNNNVKIYNRAGLLIYEQDFYDMHNPDKRFIGISNKGASIIGTELPIGTYFYVVDKNDGSKAKVGYLELNR